jgi:hypothetical protein
MKTVLPVIVLIIFLFLAFFRFLSPVDSATEAVKAHGFHPIEVGGYAWFACGDDDTFQTKFKAYTADSTRVVSGAVCQGLFKGKTLRLD